MAAGTTIELAMSALFELCVPAVSDGELPQKFPADLVVALTKAERAEYQISEKADAHRIKTDLGMIVLEIEGPYCAIITADGSPANAIPPFLDWLKRMNGKVSLDQDTQETHNIAGKIPLRDDRIISVLVSTRKEQGAAGFYGSASRWSGKQQS